jgi:uncharacterized protein (TIGR02996 family)
MSDADLLLDAIFDAPDDDTPRLVYADWLQEHGQENYAQFIRLQCEAARHKFWSDAANELWVQIGRLWPRLTHEWWPATVEPWMVLTSFRSRWPGSSYASTSFHYEPALLDAVHFDRGFPRPNIPVTAGQLLRYHTCWPWLPTPVCTLVARSVDDVTALGSFPILHRVRSVQCGDCWSTESWTTPPDPIPPSGYLDTFLRSPHLCRVRTLDLSRVAVVPSTVDVLLTAPNLSSVKEITLNIYSNAVDGGHGGAECDEVTRPLRSRFKLFFGP